MVIFTLYFLIFVLLSLVVFYIPGYWLIYWMEGKFSRLDKSRSPESSLNNQLQDQEVIALSLASAIVLFVFIAILFGLLNVRFLVLPILIISAITGLIKFKGKLFSPWRIFLKNKILLLLILLGILTQGFINFPSGYLYQNGLYFWSSQGHDGLWHVASMEAIKKSIPPENPVFSGEALYNYHYLVDVLMGEFARIFPFFSSLDLYFRFFPIIFSLLIGISVFAFVTRWQNNKTIGFWAVFFTYFVGSFGYIVLFIKEGKIFGGETVFWAAQQNTLLGNPPHAISHGLLAVFFLSFLIYLKERSLRWIILSFLIGSTLAGFKVSGGFVMLAGLGAASLIDFINRRKVLTFALTFMLGISNFLTFKWMTSNGGSFLMFLPWWFIRTMVVDRLGWMDLELRRQHYLSKGTWNAGLRVLQLETTAFIIFVVGNLGMRILGIIALTRMLLKTKLAFLKEPIEVMLVVTMIVGLLVPLFFVQKGLIYNNIQFMQYFLFIFGFYGAVSIYKLLGLIKNKIGKLIIILLLATFSLPTVIGNLVEFYGPGTAPLSKISNSEISALKYLRENSPDNVVVLTPLFNPYLKDRFKTQPLPIYAWYDTPYISALSGRYTYLASEHVRLLFYPTTKEREQNITKFFNQSDFSWNRKFLKQAKISFIYTSKGQLEQPLDLEKNNLEVFFENSDTIIYKYVDSKDADFSAGNYQI